MLRARSLRHIPPTAVGAGSVAAITWPRAGSRDAGALEIGGRGAYAGRVCNGNHAMTEEKRDLRGAVLRGWQRRCPACGAAPLMDGYLTVRSRCSACGTELYHHRADDGPAWATILIAGHLVAPLMLFVFQTWRPEAWMMASGFSAAFVVFSLYLLPRLKGVFVGVQWANRMHGFGDRPDLAAGE
jgi:uncharacterized protein (DUF983 family)